MNSAPEVDAVLGAVREIRGSLRRTFPLVRRAELRRVLQRHGLDRYPDSVMLSSRTAELAAWTYGTARRVMGRPVAGGYAHPLFSSAYYRAANPAIANLPVPMHLYWQVFGRLTGTSPHPFIDMDGLQAQIPDALPGEVLDVYLADKKHWLATPGPYVDVASFVATGPWDGTTHPLLQILRDYPSDPWIRVRLATIDLCSAPDDVRQAAGVLASFNPNLARVSGLSVWSLDESRASSIVGPYQVIPGFFIGSGGRAVAVVGDNRMSKDASAVRGRKHIVSLDVREHRACEQLVFLTAPLAQPPEAHLVHEFERSLVAPASYEDKVAFDRMGIRTLDVGRQVRVEATSLRLMGEGSWSA